MTALREQSVDSGNIPSRITEALDFASRIEYQHGAVPSHVYLKHPLRVATMLAQELEFFDPETIIIALLHNVLEVSSLSESQISDVAGSDVLRAIKALTVDRGRQDDPEYKDGYYAQIEQTSLSCARVKIADKLDNIYMLCFNPSEAVRNCYLDEIDRWVVPMAGRIMPDIGVRMAAVSAVMRETGYLDKVKELEKARKTSLP